MPGRKALRRQQRMEAAQARDAKLAEDLRALRKTDPAAFERAVGMARYDLAVTEGRHYAARRFLCIAERA